MALSSLRFAKIVATPTETAWSQAYNEGSVFAVVSLSKTEDIEPESLNTIGKEVLSLFRSEFFTLEEKSLPAIKQVLQKSLEHVPSTVLVSFVVAFNKDDLLYLLTVGGGKVVMRRMDATGILMDHTITKPTRDIHAASGVLQSDDIILLQTQEFAQKITKTKLEEALSLDRPNDIAEVLTPDVHKEEQGASAAIILSYQGPPSASALEMEEDEENEEIPAQDKPTPLSPPVDEPYKESITIEPLPQPSNEVEEVTQESKPRFTMPSLPLLPFLRLPKRTLVLLGVILLLALLLIGGIITTKTNQQASKNKEAFEKIYTEAKDKYDTGLSLLSLNKPLARDNFLKAEEILESGKDLVKDKNPEKKQYEELLQNIRSQLEVTSGVRSVQAEEADESDSLLLASYLTSKTAIAASEDEDNVYLLTPGEVVMVNKKTERKTTAITNDDLWENGIGIGSYLGNLYVLDSQKGVIKFVKSGNSYADSSYFKQTPDLEKAVGMGIDGAIYILFSDGTIRKYTKGAEDSFKFTGLSTPLSSPSKIYTTADLDNLYILEPKSSRIVVLEKNGTFVKEVSSSVLSKAKDLQVAGDAATAYILSDDKIYSLPLN